jgi:hypothetical protein
MSKQISEVTRRAIIDLFGASGINWAGRLEDDDFLARLYDLTALPSRDFRYSNAAGDIHQHCARNNDGIGTGYFTIHASICSVRPRMSSFASYAKRFIQW